MLLKYSQGSLVSRMSRLVEKIFYRCDVELWIWLFLLSREHKRCLLPGEFEARWSFPTKSSRCRVREMLSAVTDEALLSKVQGPFSRGHLSQTLGDRRQCRLPSVLLQGAYLLHNWITTLTQVGGYAEAFGLPWFWSFLFPENSVFLPHTLFGCILNLQRYFILGILRIVFISDSGLLQRTLTLCTLFCLFIHNIS